MFRLDTGPLISNKLRHACEEAALTCGQNVPTVEVIDSTEMHASSDGKVLFLASGVMEMAPAPLAAYLTLCLHFHAQLSNLLLARQREGISLSQRTRQALSRLGNLLAGRPSATERVVQLGNPNYPAEQTLALIHQARQRALANFESGQIALLQALLMVRGGYREPDLAFAGAPLFENADQLSELAKYLEMRLDGQLSEDMERSLPRANKMLRLAHKTSKLIEPGSAAVPSQVAGLNRLYASIGPVGTLAHIISRLMTDQQSDAERVSVLLELLTEVTPGQARLQLVDFAASRLLKLAEPHRQSLFTQLREAMSRSTSAYSGPLSNDDPHILAWTLLSVLRSKIYVSEEDEERREVLNDKDKRRCLTELFFVAAELGGEEASISARALRNQVDAVCETLGIDRPVSSPDEFQVAAWMEALEDLSRFSLHETLSILDALSAWGKDSDNYQVWLDALCQRLRIQRDNMLPLQPKVLRPQYGEGQAQYGDGQPRALHTDK